MQIRFADARPGGAFVLAVPVAGNLIRDAVSAFGPSAPALAERAAAAARFEGDANSLVEVVLPEGDGARRVLLVGIGGDKSPAAFEQAGAALTAKLLRSGETRLVIDLTGSGASADAAALLASGATLRGWHYDTYRTRLPANARKTLDEVVIVGAPAGTDTAWARLKAIADGVALTRELVAEPANIIYPVSFVERVTAALDGTGVQIEVLDEEAMQTAGMGSLLGVSQGSYNEARLLVMRWDGTGGTADPVALVGKGVTFDTGGISIKPAAGMEDMKWDMGGAGAVAGAILALAGRKARVNVIGVCGLVENMPDGKAQRPGDVVTSMSGQTIEVINTDAEGRLVLCDAITWVQRRYRPKTIVDLATLTGAMIIALGHEYGGLFANDDSLADQLSAAGKAVGEKLWRMPMGEPYNKMIDSAIADIRNVGPREGGSITAAHFILRFVEEGVRWAHLDIAGMVWASKPGPLWDKGATGYGVRLLDRFIADNFES